MLRHNRTSAIALALLGAAGAAGCNGSETDDGPSSPCDGRSHTAFVGVDVLRMTHEQVLPDQTVVVTDGLICQVGPRTAVLPPPEAEIIDGAGWLLMPGLADMHVHLQSISYEQDPAVYLAHGVTTIRNMWGFDWTLTLRDEIAEGDEVGPEIFTTGPIMDGDPPIWPQSEVVTTADEAALSVQQQVGASYDFIKIYNRLSLDVFDAIVAAAAEHDIPVVGHVPDAVGLEHGLQSGVSSIEHLEGYQIVGSDGRLEALTAELGVANCPTLVVYDKYARVEELQQQEIDELRYVHPLLVDGWMTTLPYAPNPFEAVQAKVEELHELGAPLLAGTDVSNPFVIPGLALHEELALLVDAGLSPYQALRKATVDAAAYLGTDDQVGTIEHGKQADLLLLAANPLEDITNTRRIEGVMLDGAWHPAADLQERLEAVATFYTDTYNLDFDCTLPPDYLTPAAMNHAAFRVKGILVGADDSSDYVSREFDVFADGQAWDVSSYGAFVYVDDSTVVEQITVVALSGMQLMGQGHTAYQYFSASVPRATLQSAKSSGDHEIDAAGTTLFFGTTEMKRTPTDTLYKFCAKAVTDPAAQGSSLYVCHEPNVDFRQGEPLQLGSNQTLTTDPAVVQAALGLPAPCSCWKNQSEPLSCAAFDAQ